MELQPKKKCALVLRSLSEDIRLRIIKCLFGKEYSVSDIAEILEAKHSQVSHHLCILRNSGIVEDRREGKFIIYRIHPLVYTRLENKDVLDFECCSIVFNDDYGSAMNKY